MLNSYISPQLDRVSEHIIAASRSSASFVVSSMIVPTNNVTTSEVLLAVQIARADAAKHETAELLVHASNGVESLSRRKDQL